MRIAIVRVVRVKRFRSDRRKIGNILGQFLVQHLDRVANLQRSADGPRSEEASQLFVNESAKR